MIAYSMIATGQDITHAVPGDQVYGRKAVALCGRKVYVAAKRPTVGRLCLICERYA